jgi:hypothetical protein
MRSKQIVLVGAASAQFGVGAVADVTALAQGMFIVALISWIPCLLFYTFVYRTYPSDAEKIRRTLEQRRKELEEMK